MRNIGEQDQRIAAILPDEKEGMKVKKKGEYFTERLDHAISGFPSFEKSKSKCAKEECIS